MWLRWHQVRAVRQQVVAFRLHGFRSRAVLPANVTSQLRRRLRSLAVLAAANRQLLLRGRGVLAVSRVAIATATGAPLAADSRAVARSQQAA